MIQEVPGRATYRGTLGRTVVQEERRGRSVWRLEVQPTIRTSRSAAKHHTNAVRPDRIRLHQYITLVNAPDSRRGEIERPKPSARMKIRERARTIQPCTRSSCPG